MVSPDFRFVKSPGLLLEQIRTKDDRINAIIDTFIESKDKVKRFFKISYIFEPEEGRYAQEVERLEKIIDIFDKIMESLPEPEKKEAKMGMITEEIEPADVICSATIEKLLINGEINQITEEGKKQYLEKKGYIQN